MYSFEKQKQFNTETANPQEFAQRFAGMSRRERKNNLNAFGYAIEQTYDWINSRRPPSEFGAPAQFSLLHEGGHLVVHDGSVEGAITGRIEAIARPTPDTRIVGFNKKTLLPSEKYISNKDMPSTFDPDLKVDFSGEDFSHPGLLVHKEGNGYRTSTVGYDQYSQFDIDAGFVKARSNDEVIGCMLMLAEAHLPQGELEHTTVA